MTFTSHSAAETEAVGRDLGRFLEERGRDRAFIAFRGEMGVGKTAFTRGFASHFGITGVKSPTYTIVNEYAGRVRIFHFDMYRINDDDELYSMGFYDYLDDKRAISLVEWSENITYAFPKEYLVVKIEKNDPENTDERLISIYLEKVD